jgi:hypothetical protein
MANPFQVFHVLSTHARLAEFKELMRRRWIVQHDLEDIGTEEVCNTTTSEAGTGGGYSRSISGLR